METAVVWVPGDFQLMNNWTTMEPAAMYAPGIPVESYASTEMYGSCLETPVVSTGSSGGHQLGVEYAKVATNKNDQFEVDLHGTETKIGNPIHVFQRAASEFEADINMMRMKIHRYPGIIKALPEWYTSPTMVAIGPYHHGQDHLKPAEKAKHVAAYHCIRESGHSVQEMYDAVASLAQYARGLYDKDAVAGIGDDDFLPMLFYDACFLVQYMLNCTRFVDAMDPSLRSFMDSNDDDIYHDILLLENQIPWRVVQAIMRFRPVPLEDFIVCLKDGLRDRKDAPRSTFFLDDGFEPPHLLGLLRYYIVGRSNTKLPTLPQTESISFSVNAIELAEIGIAIKSNKRPELIHMGLSKTGVFAELSLAPVSLDASRASLLVNMAALELCTTSNFQDADDEESAVCSYLLLLAMIVSRDEDVHELRTRHLLQGGGGFTNGEALEFLTRLQGLRLGSRYVRTMREIENYKVKRPVRTKAHAFVYKNFKAIVMVCTAIAGLVGFLETLKSLKER